MSLLVPARTRIRVTPQPSAGVWPGLHDVSRAPVHAAIAKRLTKAAVKKLPLTMAFPDGSSWGAGGPVLQVVNPESFFRRLGTEGLIGFGEAWMTGDITTGGWSVSHPAADFDVADLNAASDELAAALTVMAKRMSVLVPGVLQKLRRAWQTRPPKEEENTLTGAKENIHRHYYLSNYLFDHFLYSPPPPPPPPSPPRVDNAFFGFGHFVGCCMHQNASHCIVLHHFSGFSASSPTD